MIKYHVVGAECIFLSSPLWGVVYGGLPFAQVMSFDGLSAPFVFQKLYFQIYNVVYFSC